ncbi:MAG TPA: energy transducer TonB [Pyrinomonadaceae bacterium]|nr:energy transducer TonB [Chloracidobacterium sp.]HBE83420.1 hypothetical protein [Blastocatellia bacterium]HRJ89948.1 energy transducer TonB [Pyrinomonadaceae bacterium]HRK51287.1 energy transducer TonB [Pyrinomonadaceae bacterium]
MTEVFRAQMQQAGQESSLRAAAVRCLVLAAAATLFAVSGHTQKLAFLTPENDPANAEFKQRLSDAVGSSGLKIVDSDAARIAFETVAVENPLNMAAREAQQAGAVIGCDIFIITAVTNQRRSSFQKAQYYEAAASVFVVSSRTGRLVHWRLADEEAASPEEANRLLFDSALPIAAELRKVIADAYKNDVALPSGGQAIQALDPESAAAAGIRSPIPYKRIKPVYTPQAYLFGVRATVDAEVDIDGSGNILRIDIVRWAGYGLDESVAEAIRTMNWRPAERGGKTLPMRVLLRYNFIKIEKEEP